MESYIQKLPNKYADILREKLEDYNKSNETDSILENQIVNLIFNCASEYPNTFWELEKICRYQNQIRLAIENHVDEIGFNIVHSALMEIDDETWWTLKFIAYLSTEEWLAPERAASHLISGLFQLISCDCETKHTGNICDCVDNQVSQKQFDELQLKNEYPIQCGIVFLESMQKSEKNNEFLNIAAYWLKRLRKLWRYFGEKTQEMIEQLLKRYNQVEIDVKTELKELYEERIENEKLKYEKNIEELNQKIEQMKNDMEISKNNEEQIKYDSLIEKAELQKMIQELNQRIEQMTNDMER